MWTDGFKKESGESVTLQAKIAETRPGLAPGLRTLRACGPVMQELIPKTLVSALREARSVVVLTGAGVSAESGIPTFRDAMEGLWAKYDAYTLATPEGFASDPALVAKWYDWRRMLCAMAPPNPAHHALAQMQAQLQARQRKFTLVTQNVDRLHQAAGSTRVIELHGTLWVWRCTDCGEEREEREVPFLEHPPKCRKCGGKRRPGVVWFGEPLPGEVVDVVEVAEKAESREQKPEMQSVALLRDAATKEGE